MSQAHRRRLSLEALGPRELLAGDLDLGFGDFGKLSAPVQHVTDSFHIPGELTVDPAGRIVALTRLDSGRGNVIALSRWNSQGQLDQSFGDSGYVRYPINPQLMASVDVAVQSSGRIVVLAQVRRVDNNSSITPALIGFDTDGQLDMSFGFNGIEHFLYSPPNHRQPGGLLVGANDELYVVSADADQTHLSKFYSDGRSDLTFGDLGTLSISTGYSSAHDLIELPSGDIVFASSNDDFTNTYRVSLFKADANGELDIEFGNGGVLSLIGTRETRDAKQVRMQSLADGFLVALLTPDDQRGSFVVAKYGFDGAPDDQYGVQGQAVVSTSGAYGARLQDIEIASDGSAVLTVGLSNLPHTIHVSAQGVVDRSRVPSGINQIGSTSIGSNRYPNGSSVMMPDGNLVSMVMRLSDVGLLSFSFLGLADQSFGTQGEQTLDDTVLWSGVDVLDLQALPGGKFLAVTADLVDRDPDSSFYDAEILLRRYHGNGVIDTTFGNQGTELFSLDRFGSFGAAKIVERSDGFVFSYYNDLRVVFVPLNSDGEIVLSDGDETIEWTVPTCDSQSVSDVGADDQGFLVSTYCRDFSTTGGVYGQVHRLNRDGTPDNPFGAQSVLEYEAEYWTIMDLKALPDGSFYGVRFDDSGFYWDLAVQHFRADGQIDTSFGDQGVVKLGRATGSLRDLGELIQPLADGGMLVLNTAGNSKTGTVTVTKLRSDGSIESDFGESGSVEIGEGTAQLGKSIRVTPDGKIVVATFVTSSIESGGLVHRLMPDGSPDTTFGVQGIVEYEPSETDSIIRSVELTADGNVLVGGTVQNELAKEPVIVHLIDDAPTIWQNASNPEDANLDNVVSPRDALAIVNYLALQGEAESAAPEGVLFYDVNDDSIVSPLDALVVINRLARMNEQSNSPLQAEAVDLAFLPRPSDVDREDLNADRWLLEVPGFGF